MPLQKVRSILAIVLGGLLTGCPTPKLGAVESIITVQSAAATYGLDIKPTEACIWIIGRFGVGKGISMVVGHGGITAEECMKLGVYTTPE